MNPQTEIIAIAVLTSLACVIPGVFLVLRRMALMSDAISHSILPGIVLMFFLIHDLESPLLMLGAVLTGLFTVTLTELLNKSRLVKEDAAIGMVFPVFFSIGVILVARYAGNVHLDTDSVLLGELAFAPFSRFNFMGYDIASKSLVQMAFILIFNIILFTLIYKEVKLSTFDPGLAVTLGFMPGMIQYLLMISVSVTAVGAFDSVGSVLVVALMVAPPAAAYLLVNSLGLMIILSAIIAVISSLVGYALAIYLDTSIAGSMAAMGGLIFLLSFLFAPERGLIALRQRRDRQKWSFARDMLVVHLLHHQDKPEAVSECRESHLLEHISWSKDFAERVVRRAVSEHLVRKAGDLLSLTAEGKKYASSVMVAS